VDSVNRTVISCSLDGKIKFWDFATGVLRHEIDWHPMTAITACRYHRASDLLALSCDDLSIRIVDIETRRLVRELWGCIGQIRDYCFSNDGRWIVAGSMDSVVRVWDLPTGHLINAMRLESTCTALAFSVTGEFLATAHANSSGINVWTNRSLFTHVPTRNIDEREILQVNLPTTSGDGGQTLLAAAFDEEDADDNEDTNPVGTIEQLSSDMTTLSLIPRSRWQTLLHLDTIAARNKPVEPPKAPEKAPFFLPSIEKTNSKALVPTESAQDAVEVTTIERSRISALQSLGARSNPFTSLLRASATSHEPFISHLKSLSPSAADIEIRSLDPAASSGEMILFIRALTARLRERKDYEVVQAWMAVFLRLHGEIIGQDPELCEALAHWRKVQQSEGERLGALVGYCGGVVSFLRSGR
jgi:U3 small nucleolar RNA-associated protein 21